MAKTGLSKSYYALYTYNSTDGVTYADGGLLGKAVSASIEPEEGEDNNFYADNGIAESDGGFNSGTLTITNDSLELTALAAIMGLTPASDGSLHFSANMTAPYVGYGTIGRSQVNGVRKFRAIILCKVQFHVPVDELSTQEEDIEFSGHELTATILRTDDAAADWKIVKDFDTEANAEAYIKTTLSITA